MQYNRFFLIAIALMVSTNAPAGLSVSTTDGAGETKLVYGVNVDGDLVSVPINFGDVCADIAYPPNYETFLVEVTNNNDDEATIDSLTVSISGNSSELCISEPGANTCPPQNEPSCVPLDNGSLNFGETCRFFITLEPAHPGKKKKKLTIDGVDPNMNDISLTIPVTGTNNNQNSSLDTACP